MPDLTLEAEAGGIVAGVDEAGRGPLAGPVIAAAVVLDPARLSHVDAAEINDSKKLPATRRESLFDAVCAGAAVGVGQASVAEIDALNILGATMRAMARAVAALAVRPDLVLVDGNRAPALACPARTVVGGDALSLSIAAASIVAKVTRDRIMRDLARAYPHYGWQRNAGYPTAEHRAALAVHGVTEHHRRSFAPVAAALESRRSSPTVRTEMGIRDGG